MDKYLRLERLEANPECPSSKQKWRHWLTTFESYVECFEEISEVNKLRLLFNHVDSSIYEYISEANDYEAALVILRDLFVKPVNEVFARYQLHTCQQQVGQSLEEFLKCLKTLSADCNYVNVNAQRYREESIRDAFVAGVRSATIRQRLLESENMQLQNVFNKTRSFELAKRNADLIDTKFPRSFPGTSAATSTPEDEQCFSSRNANTNYETAVIDEKC